MYSLLYLWCPEIKLVSFRLRLRLNRIIQNDHLQYICQSLDIRIPLWSHEKDLTALLDCTCIDQLFMLDINWSHKCPNIPNIYLSTQALTKDIAHWGGSTSTHVGCGETNDKRDWDKRRQRMFTSKIVRCGRSGRTCYMVFCNLRVQNIDNDVDSDAVASSGRKIWGRDLLHSFHMLILARSPGQSWPYGQNGVIEGSVLLWAGRRSIRSDTRS